MKLSTWAEVVGVIAVVISLALLTWELNQANNLARFSAYSDINHLYREMNQEMASSTQFAELWARLKDENTDLSEVDVQRAMGLAYWHRNIWINTERAFLEGWIDHDKYQMSLNDIESVAQTWPGFKPYMRKVVELLQGDRELTQIEQLILEKTS